MPSVYLPFEQMSFYVHNVSYANIFAYLKYVIISAYFVT